MRVPADEARNASVAEIDETVRDEVPINRTSFAQPSGEDLTDELDEMADAIHKNNAH